MAFRLEDPNIQFLDPNGVPLAGGLVYFYVSGTTTPQNTYSDPDLTTPNTNPIVLNSGGYLGNVFLIQGALYKVVVEDSGGAQQWTADPVSDPTSGGGVFSGSVAISGSSGSTRQLRFQTLGVDRFVMELNADPETGSNAGSNVLLYVADDTGTLLHNVATITRSTGAVSIIPQVSFSQVPVFPAGAGPTTQTLTSGTSATYTTPAGCVRIKVRMVGGGGGGAGCGSSGAVSGGAAGTTTFGAVTAVGGGGGAINGASGYGGDGGVGGSGGSPSVFVRLSGQYGGKGCGNITSVGIGVPPDVGGYGGSSPFGGAGSSSAFIPAARDAASFTGSGGAGAISGALGIGNGGGGGAGEYAEFWINSPAATYTYTIGGGGTAGVSGVGGAAGGAGAGGLVLVEEFYI